MRLVELCCVHAELEACPLAEVVLPSVLHSDRIAQQSFSSANQILKLVRARELFLCVAQSETCRKVFDVFGQIKLRKILN